MTTRPSLKKPVCVDVLHTLVLKPDSNFKNKASEEGSQALFYQFSVNTLFHEHQYVSKNASVILWYDKFKSRTSVSLHVDAAHGFIEWRAEVWWCQGQMLDWMPPFEILVLSSAVWWSLLLNIRCLWRHNVTSYSRLQTKRFGEVCWHNMHIQGCWSSGRPWRAVKELRTMDTFKKIVTNYVSFCSSITLTSKIITKIIENHSEFVGCPNSYNKFVSSRSW